MHVYLYIHAHFQSPDVIHLLFDIIYLLLNINNKGIYYLHLTDEKTWA